MQTSVLGCTVIPNHVIEDSRGSFTESYKRSCYSMFPSMKQWNTSFSEENVVRGMHFQAKNPQGKLVRVLQGVAIDVVVDLRVGSPNYGKMEQFFLSPYTVSVYVPVGFAHGFWAIKPVILNYGCTEEYDKDSDSGISPLDPDMPYPWKQSKYKEALLISDKDHKHVSLKDFQSPFRMS